MTRLQTIKTIIHNQKIYEALKNSGVGYGVHSVMKSMLTDNPTYDSEKLQFMYDILNANRFYADTTKVYDVKRWDGWEASAIKDLLNSDPLEWCKKYIKPYLRYSEIKHARSIWRHNFSEDTKDYLLSDKFNYDQRECIVRSMEQKYGLTNKRIAKYMKHTYSMYQLNSILDAIEAKVPLGEIDAIIKNPEFNSITLSNIADKVKEFDKAEDGGDLS